MKSTHRTRRRVPVEAYHFRSGHLDSTQIGTCPWECACSATSQILAAMGPQVSCDRAGEPERPNERKFESGDWALWVRAGQWVYRSGTGGWRVMDAPAFVELFKPRRGATAR